MSFFPRSENILWPAAGSFSRVGYHGNPKAIIAIGTGIGASPSISARPFFGAADLNGNDAYAAIATADNAATMVVRQNAATGFSAALLNLGSGAAENTIDVTSLDVDGFTATSVQGVSGSRIGFLGLTGISNAKVFSFALPVSIDPFTVSGIGFKPNLVILFASSSGGVSARRSFGIGWGVSSSSRQCVAISDRHGIVTSSANRTQRTDRLFRLIGNIASAIIVDLDLLYFTDDGMVLQDAVGSQSTTIFGLALKVPQVYLTSWNPPASLGPFDVTDCPFAPDTMLTLSWNNSAQTFATIQPESRMSFGFAAGPTNGEAPWDASTSNECCATFHSEDNKADSNCDQDFDFNSVYRTVYPASPFQDVINLDSFLGNGARLNYTIGGIAPGVLTCFIGGARPSIILPGGILAGGVLGA